MKLLSAMHTLGAILCSIALVRAQDFETVKTLYLSIPPAKSYYINESATIVPGSSGIILKPVSDQFFIRFNPTRAGGASRHLNHILSEDYYASVNDLKSAKSLHPNMKKTQTEYFDGLGTSIQKIDRNFSPTSKDLVSFREFDSHGRELRTYLPYTIVSGAEARAEPVKDQKAFYSGTAKVVKDSEPFNTNYFDDSPLKRVERSFSPGWKWHNDAESLPLKNSFDANATSEVYLISISALDIPLFREDLFYPPNSLRKSVKSSESGLTTIEYTDYRGNKVMEKVGKNNMWHVTYYVFDSSGNIRFVFPPQATKYLPQYKLARDQQGFLNAWCFQYKYDNKLRLIEKKVPGGGWIYTIYDAWGRPVLTQDAKQRQRSKWTFTKYDIHNRPICTGIITGDRTTLTEAANKSTVRYESRANNSVGYTNVCFPSHSTADLLTINYYDCYNFVRYNGWDTDGLTYLPADEPGLLTLSDLIAPGDPAVIFAPTVKGYLTGTKIRILETDRWLNSVNYYDHDYRIAQTIAKNQFAKADRITTRYNAFTGKPFAVKRHHSGPDGTISIREEYVYDNYQRLQEIYHQINDEPRVLMSSNRYNELGQLVEKNVHQENSAAFLQSTDYTYNVQGWLKGINSVPSGEVGNNDDDNDLFGMDLIFEDKVVLYNTGFSPRRNFDGRVAAVKWQTNIPGKPSEERIYGFTYDEFGRFKQSNYATRTSAGWVGNAGLYDERIVSYDNNGNIVAGTSAALVRYGLVEGTKKLIDNNAYRYSGNQLRNVRDLSLHPSGFRDKAGVVLGVNEMNYDANGNIIEDQNRSITSIKYNHLNLPDEIVFTRAQAVPVRDDRIVFLYDANGNKLRKEVHIGNQKVWVTNYAGGIQYDNGKISFINTQEGRAVSNGSGYEYEYFVKDYQSNVRIVYGLFNETDRYLATMEPALDSRERNQFGFRNITETRAAGNNITPSTTEVLAPGYAARCRAYSDGSSISRAVGPAKSLKVSAGEIVYAETFARFNNAKTSSQVLATTLLAGQVTGAFAITQAENPILWNNMRGCIPGVSLSMKPAGSVPKGYLILLYFDNNYIFKRAAAAGISERAFKNFEKLSVSSTPETDGYVYIYVVNESNESAMVDVFFDDLYILRQKKNKKMQVVQASDFYPFGLSFNGYETDRLRSVGSGDTKTYEPVLRNRVLFQDQELLADFDLGWYQFKHRMHDPAIGRFGVIDPLAAEFTHNSPYAFSENKLLQGVELEGAELRQLFETVKYVSPVSINSHGSLTSHDSKIGMEISIGMPKLAAFSYRKTFGFSINTDDILQGKFVFETRSATETSHLMGLASFQSTKYNSGETSQTTGMITLGGPLTNVQYENDWFDQSWMNYLDPFGFHPRLGGDGGDRFRTAALRVNMFAFNAGFRLATGDPGPLRERQPIATLGGKGGLYVPRTINGVDYDPDKYRLGLGYIGLGPYQIGVNSEWIRHNIQNRFAHDFLQQPPSPWFQIMPGYPQLYLGFNSGTSTQW